MKIVNIFFISGKHVALNVDDTEREELIRWLNNMDSVKKYTIEQKIQTGSMTHILYKDNIEYAVY